MKETYTKWALSTETWGGRRFLWWLDWGLLAWKRSGQNGLRLFSMRKDARNARQTCGHKLIRVEKVRVTVETI